MDLMLSVMESDGKFWDTVSSWDGIFTSWSWRSLYRSSSWHLLLWFHHCYLSSVCQSITDLCPCGETQTMSHIVESCPDKTDKICEWHTTMKPKRCCHTDAAAWRRSWTHPRSRGSDTCRRSNVKRLFSALECLVESNWGQTQDYLHHS